MTYNENWIYLYREIHVLFRKLMFSLKQENRYLWVIIVCRYFSVIRSFTRLNYPSESNSYHKTSLSVSFGCWHLSGTSLFPLHFTVYTIAWQRKFEPLWVLNTYSCILSVWKVKHQPLSLRMYQEKVILSNNMHSISSTVADAWSDFFY